MVPTRVSADIVKRLNQALNAVVNSSQVQDALKIQGVEPAPGSPETVTAVIRADIIKWRDIVVTAKIAGPK